MSYETAAISGVIAGLMAILITVAIEKFGGIVGGVLGSIPSTIVPAAIGFYLEFLAKGDVLSFQRALLVIPSGMVINSVFLYLWKLLPELIGHHLKVGFKSFLAIITFLTLVVWFSLAVCLVLLLRFVSEGAVPTTSDTLRIEDSVSIIYVKEQSGIFYCGFIGVIAQIALGLLNSWNLPPAPKGSASVSLVQKLSRGVLAALAISPFAAGIASIFPAIFLTTMVSVWLSQGKAVTQGAVGPLILGSVSVSTFAISAAFICPFFHISKNGDVSYITCAFFVSWIGSAVLVSPALYLFLRWRRSRTSSAVRAPPQQKNLET